MFVKAHLVCLPESHGSTSRFEYPSPSEQCTLDREPKFVLLLPLQGERGGERDERFVERAKLEIQAGRGFTVALALQLSQCHLANPIHDALSCECKIFSFLIDLLIHCQKSPFKMGNKASTGHFKWIKLFSFYVS